MDRIRCSLPILTLNARATLERLLPAVIDHIDDVYIMDGNSTDGTREYAESLGIRVEKQFDHDIPNTHIQNFSAMRLKLWSKARYEWLLLLDADELPTPEFLTRVRAEVEANNPKRAIRFYGRAELPDGSVVKQAFFYRNRYIRLFNTASGITLAAKDVHERFEVPADIIQVDADEPFASRMPPIDVLMRKQDRYLALEIARAKRLSWLGYVRWVLIFGLRAALSEFFQSVICWAKGLWRGERALPWEYVRLYVTYHFKFMFGALHARIKTQEPDQISKEGGAFMATSHLPTDPAKRQTLTSGKLGEVRKRVLLLNPPGTKRFFRDYFCTLVSKASYYYHPVDLVYLSGVFDRAGYYIDCVDAIASGLSPESTIRRAQAFQPDIVVYLLASPSYEEDVPFLTKLKEALPKAVFIGSGDVYREIREDGLRIHPFCDAILTDFSTRDVLTWLNRTEDSLIDNIIYRGQDGRVYAGVEKHGHGFYHMPVPRWDLWPREKYRFPFAESARWATILTDFGCPFSCTFCPMSTTGYKLRDLDTVQDELRFLSALGIHEIFIRDQTFGVNRVRTEELLRRFRQFPKLRWTCWSRVDLVNEEFLRLIYEAGCHTIMFGIESANEDILKKYKKNTKREQMVRALATARSIGLKTVGTFVLGLPGESEASIRQTIAFAKQLPLDYASFNIATPRFGTTFRRLMKEDGALNASVMSLDSSHAQPAWLKNGEEMTLSNDAIFLLQRLAIRSFYLRPGFLLRRLLTVRTPYQLWSHIREGFELIFSLL